MENEKMMQFLEEIKSVSEKYGLFLNDESCGCCGYTHVVDENNEQVCERLVMFYDGSEKEYVIKPSRH